MYHHSLFTKKLLFDSPKIIKYIQNIRIVEYFTRQTLNLQELLRKFSYFQTKKTKSKTYEMRIII